MLFLEARARFASCTAQPDAHALHFAEMHVLAADSVEACRLMGGTCLCCRWFVPEGWIDMDRLELGGKGDWKGKQSHYPAWQENVRGIGIFRTLTLCRVLSPRDTRPPPHCVASKRGSDDEKNLGQITSIPFLKSPWGRKGMEEEQPQMNPFVGGQTKPGSCCPLPVCQPGKLETWGRRMRQFVRLQAPLATTMSQSRVCLYLLHPYRKNSALDAWKGSSLEHGMSRGLGESLISSEIPCVFCADAVGLPGELLCQLSAWLNTRPAPLPTSRPGGHQPQGESMVAMPQVCAENGRGSHFSLCL
jgi:hypothetical protein